MSHHETIEVPDMEQFDALTSDVASLKGQLGTFKDLRLLLALITDAKAVARRVDELTGMITQAIETAAGAERAKAELAAQTRESAAELAKRAAAIADREEAVTIREENVADRYGRLDEANAMVRQHMELLKSRLMQYAGIVRLPLQSDFSFEQVENLLRGSRDAHFDEDPASPGDGRIADDPTNIEPAPYRVGGSTLTHSRERRPAN